MRLTVGTKLIGTYLAMIALMVAPVVVIAYYLHHVRGSQVQVLSFAQPAVAAAKGVREGLHQSAAGLRGEMAVGSEHFRQQQVRGQQQAQQSLEQLDTLTRQGSSEDRQALDQLRRELGDIAAIHQAMQNSPRQTTELPAMQKLAGDTTPLGERMLHAVNAIIHTEQKLEKTPQRTRLLEQMTALRAALHGSLVEMHSYLTTAEERHIKSFGEKWTTANAGLASLTAQRRMLTLEQGRDLTQIANLVGQFQPLPDRLFAMRKSESWNMAQQRMKDEAAPREAQAEALLAAIIQRTEARAQQAQQTLHAQSAWLALATTGGPGAAAGIGILFGWLVTRRVSRRLQQTVQAMEAVAAGQVNARMPVTTQDEFGRLAKAINTIATNTMAAQKQRVQAQTTVSQASAQEYRPQLDTDRLRSLVNADAQHRRMHIRPQAAPVQAATHETVTNSRLEQTEVRQTLQKFQSALGQIVATANQLSQESRQVAASSQQVQAGSRANFATSPPTAAAASATQGLGLSTETEKLAVSSERLRNDAAQLTQLMQRLQQSMVQSQATAAEEGVMQPQYVDEANDTNTHGPAGHLSGPKASHGVRSSTLQTV